MKLSRQFAMLASVLILSSCASMQEVQVPPERFVLKGFSFIPLNEKGWLIRGRNPHQVVLFKLGANPDESIGIVARKYVEESPLRSSEEIVRLLEKVEKQDSNLERFKALKQEIIPHREKGSNCARSHITSEDHAPVRRTTRTEHMIIDTVSLACAHPKDNRTIVYVGFSQRAYPGQGDPHLLEKAQQIFGSLEFSDL